MWALILQHHQYTGEKSLPLLPRYNVACTFSLLRKSHFVLRNSKNLACVCVSVSFTRMCIVRVANNEARQTIHAHRVKTGAKSNQPKIPIPHASHFRQQNAMQTTPCRPTRASTGTQLARIRRKQDLPIDELKRTVFMLVACQCWFFVAHFMR